MATIRVLPGAVTAHSLRALVLAATPQPSVTLLRQRDGREIPAALTPLPSSQALQDELTRHGVRLFVLVAVSLHAGTTYAITYDSDGARRQTVVRTLPQSIAAEGLTIAVASCFYRGFNQAGNYLATLRSRRFSPPACKFLIGDNLYLDIGPRQAWHSGGYAETVDDYLDYFWRSAYAEAVGELPTFTTWDDHEFWNNFPEDQPWLSRSWFNGALRQGYIDAAQECLRLFQATLNPPPVAARGLSYRFDIAPLSFFVADIRSERTLQAHETPQMWSAEELQAFQDWAAQLEAPGVLVIGQPLWLGAGGKTDYNPPAFEQDYALIWKALQESRHDILVMSGDVHHSRVIEIEISGRTIREFITSPVCHIPTGFTTVLGTFSAQGKGKVSLARSVEVNQRLAPGVRPKLGRYLMGSNARNTMAFVHFQPRAGEVEVGAAFVDLQTQQVPEATEADLSGWFSGSKQPVFARCERQVMFTLR